ncbi:MAG: PAS domain-containing protein [Anaerolineae bacterium]|nr:PAS domain-containing protein [Anaerolineae bacterium]
MGEMDLLFDALNRSADGAYVIDADQRIVFWNAAAERMLGYGSAEVIGRPCHEVLQGRDDNNNVWCRMRCKVAVRSSKGDAVDTFTVCAQSSQGTPRWINVSILPFPVTTESGARLVVHLFRDGTVQKQQEALSNQILMAVQTLQLPVAGNPVPPVVAASQHDVMLTHRELQVLDLLARGMNTTAVAESLSISVSTTRNHIQNIFQKLQVHSRAQAVAYAFEHGLVSHQ